MERFVDAAPGVQLWSERVGPVTGDPVLLLAAANTSGLAWPDELLARLTERHPVIRYDHRDTGRSTWGFDDAPYTVAELAADAVAVLDAWEADRAHVVGMALGGTLGQLLLLDHPHRLCTATLLCARGLAAAGELPGPGPSLQRLWQELDDPRDDDGEIAWRIEHWRLLHGPTVPFDPAEFRALETRILAHTGHPVSPSAHTRLDPPDPRRAAELVAATVPTLVVEAEADPVNPPPHGQRLARSIGGARLLRIPGMGHAVGAGVAAAVADAILEHTALAGRARGPVASAAAHLSPQ